MSAGIMVETIIAVLILGTLAVYNPVLGVAGLLVYCMVRLLINLKQGKDSKINDVYTAIIAITVIVINIVLVLNGKVDPILIA